MSLNVCISLLGLPEQSATDWVAKIMEIQNCGGWKSKIKVSAGSILRLAGGCFLTGFSCGFCSIQVSYLLFLCAPEFPLPIRTQADWTGAHPHGLILA